MTGSRYDDWNSKCSCFVQISSYIEKSSFRSLKVHLILAHWGDVHGYA